MRNNKRFVYTSIGFLLFSALLCAREGHEANPHYEWVEGKETAVREDGIYIASNKGMMRLNVVEYDRENDRYLVLCSCLEKPYLDPFESLRAPYVEGSE